MAMQVCTPGLNILEEMGVLKELVDNNEAHFADSGGFVSPSGLTYIGACRHSFFGGDQHAPAPYHLLGRARQSRICCSPVVFCVYPLLQMLTREGHVQASRRSG